MNVVVVVARGLRADMLGCYGNLWIETPNLDALAADGVLFDWHFADCPSAWRSWLTGRYHFSGENEDASGRLSTLLDHLKAKNITTFLVRDRVQDQEADDAMGWDRVITAEPDEEHDALEQVLVAAEKALKKLAHQEGWLLWIELSTTLPPWDVPPDFQETYLRREAVEEEEVEVAIEENSVIEPLTNPPLGPVDDTDDELYDRLQSSYAGAVSYLDAGIGLLREKVSGLREGDDTLLIVTSDFGFPLGEHGVVGREGSPPHEELIHVPLLMRLPNEAEAGRRVRALTQTVDLAPTLAEAFGLHAAEAQGCSLWPLMRGEEKPIREYIVSGSGAYCLRTPSWALHRAERGSSLFAKPEDRSEVNDLAQHHLEWVEYLERLLHDFIAATKKAGPLDAPTLCSMQEIVERSGVGRSEPKA